MLLFAAVIGRADVPGVARWVWISVSLRLGVSDYSHLLFLLFPFYYDILFITLPSPDPSAVSSPVGSDVGHVTGYSVM